jgi:hypothetical protein
MLYSVIKLMTFDPENEEITEKFYSPCRLFQPAHVIIDFALNDGSGKSASQQASDVLVLNLEALESRQKTSREAVSTGSTGSTFPFCYTSLLHVR